MKNLNNETRDDILWGIILVTVAVLSWMGASILNN